MNIRDTSKEQVRFINIKEFENNELENECKHLEDRSDTLKNKIRELELRIDLVKKETEEEKNMLMERDLLNKIKFEELESKYSELQKKAFSLKQEKINRNKNKIVSTENKSYRLKKIRNNYMTSKEQMKNESEILKQKNTNIKSEIVEKKKYLDDLLNKLNIMNEKATKEPGYLRSKSRKKEEGK